MEDSDKEIEELRRQIDEWQNMDDTRELAISIIEKFEELLNKHSIKL